MNKLKGKITAVNSSDSLTKIDVVCYDMHVSAFVLDASKRYDETYIGKEVAVLFKESEVAIAKNLQGEISLQNRFTCTIEAVEKGALLAQLRLRFHDVYIDSIITSASAQRMHLEVGDGVSALVKSTEITLKEEVGDA
jgi:molybdate transport system regulatory protein